MDLNENDRPADNSDLSGMIFQSLPFPVLIFNTSGTIIDTNFECREFLGFDPAGTGQSDFIKRINFRNSQEKGPSLQELIFRTLQKKKKSGDYFFTLRTHTGGNQRIRCCCAPLADGAETRGVVCLWFEHSAAGKAFSSLNTQTDGLLNMLDSIEKLKTEKDVLSDKYDRVNIELEKKETVLEKQDSQIKEQSRILEKIFSNTHFLIAYLDKDFNYIRVNYAFAISVKKNEEFFRGKNHFRLFPESGIERIFTRVRESGFPYVAYAKVFFQPGNSGTGNDISFWDWSVQPVKNHDGSVEGLILILIDVSKRKQAEEELLEAQRKLSESKRLSDIGTLAATVAHELRNPLGVIQAALYNILRKNRNEALIKHINKIDKKISESEQIINNLLGYSRIKKPIPKEVHLYNYMTECVANVQSQYMDSGIELKTGLSGFTGISARLDPFQIREVVTNVLANAYQSMPEHQGQIAVTGRIEDETIIISVSDTGEGIEAEYLDLIYDPFFTMKSKGTGLGLTICKELLSLHGGRISVTSEKGTGTTVHIHLPLNYDKDHFLTPRTSTS